MTKARILSFLMVVCLATTCMLSGTIAKYTTNDSNNDDAIVGKWGVVLGIHGTLFGEKYSVKDGVNGNIPANTGSFSVASGTAPLRNVVAPGTKSDKGMTITLTGTPEVGVKVSIEAVGEDVVLKNGTYAILAPVNKSLVTAENFETNTYYKIAEGKLVLIAAHSEIDALDAIYVIDDQVTVDIDDEDGYYPVKYSFTGLNNVTKAADFAELLNDKEDIYDPNTNLATEHFEYESSKTVLLNGLNVSWAWGFETMTGDPAAVDPDVDAMDTVLGALIFGAQTVVSITGTAGAGEDDYILVANNANANSIEANGTEVAYLKTYLSIEITVEQVD